MVALAHHWQLALSGAVIGLALGVAFVAVCYLTPIVRLRLAADPTEQAQLLHRELARLQRLGNAGAVYEEHGLAGARELREEAEFRTLLLLLGVETKGRHR